MRIYFASQSFYPHIGGVPTYLLNLAKELANRGNEVVEVHLRPSGEVHRDEIKGIEVHRVPQEPINQDIMQGYSRFKEAVYTECLYDSGKFRIPHDQIPGYEEYNKVNQYFGEQLRNLLEQKPADIVHIHDFQLLFGYRYVPRGMPCILTWHIPFRSSMSRPLGKFLIKHLKEYDKVVFSSPEYIKNAVDMGLPKEKTQLIYPVSNTKLFRPLKIDKVAVKEKYGIPPESPVILCVNRVGPKLGHEQLIRALPSIVKKVPDTKLVFVGGDSMSSKLSKDRQELKKKVLDVIKELGMKKNIIWTGTVNYHDLPELYNCADVVTLCSKNEGFGLVVTEGMACGKPVVGTRAGGIPLQVADGENGYLVDVGDISTTSDRIIRILKDSELNKRMSEKSLEIVDRQFKIERAIGKHMVLYNSLITDKDEFRRIDYLKASDFKAIITDMDRTIVDPAPKHVFDPGDYDIELLEEFKKIDCTKILATGRVIRYVKRLCTEFDVWDCVIAENGAVIYFPKTRKTITTNTSYMKKAKKIIRDMDLPGASIGKIIASVPVKYEQKVKEKLQDLADHLSFFRNVDELMVLPHGTDKGMGVRLALKHLNIDIDKTFVIGDAENDMEMFLNPGFKVAVANADRSIKKLSNYITKGPSTKGVREIIRKIQEN
ncbi:glycosyltransferase [Candidatus Woesearchaeota archaeon]|nr:glycosyltransferase [Candidatus Woesearchaeota archaeon]